VVGGATDVVLPRWSTDWDRYELFLSNIPAGAVELSPGVTPIVDALPIELGSNTFSVDAPRVSARIPAGLSQRFEIELDVTYASPFDISNGLIQVFSDAPATMEMEFDLERWLPPIRDLELVTVPPNRTALRWTSDSLLDSDGILAGMIWMADVPTWWVLLMPPDAGPSVALPELPGEVFAAPPSQSADYIIIAMVAVESTLIAGYDQLRTEHGMNAAPDDLRRDLRTADSGAAIRYSLTMKEHH
jgi:hypothetical protein